MADMPERIVAWYFEHRKDKPMWLDASSGHGGTEYVRADICAKELSQLAIESKDRELALARLEGEVIAIRDRYEFLEKALDQAVRHLTCYRDPRYPLVLIADDEDELAQYLKEKTEG